ncbi:MAG: hypothetical protein KIS30_02430 [Thermoplasmata archaeon]|nr:hypothetical protein [Candidatus Sysuiplasma acidicola]MBX8645603.1 hypothetical protein [Candidatus Sysuiplasma acidicola]
MANLRARKFLKAYGWILLATGLIWLSALLYLIALNFNPAFLIGIAVVALSTPLFTSYMRHLKPRPWTNSKITLVLLVTLLYLALTLSSFLFFAIRGKTHFVSFIAALFLLYMAYISIRTWFRTRSFFVFTLDAATVIAVAVNVVASIISLRDMLVSYGRGVLVDLAIVLVVISTTSTKHGIISGALHYIQGKISAFRRRRAEKHKDSGEQHAGDEQS